MDHENIYYFTEEGSNFGDILSPYLVDLMDTSIDEPVIIIGSILNFDFPKPVNVWGSGFLSENKSTLKSKNLNKFYAVRGPKTWKLVLKQGFDCPEIFGDPSLFLPYLVSPAQKKKKATLGILPHWIDLDEVKQQFRGFSSEVIDIRIIDIRSGIEQVIKKTTECHYLISSSLHGVILGESYGIPTCFAQMSLRLAEQGDTFKFEDYFQSTNRELFMLDWKNPQDRVVYNAIEFAESVPKPQIDLQKLVEAFPFEIKNQNFLSDIKGR